MKKIFFSLSVLFFSIFSQIVFAQSDQSTLLNQITLSLSADQWVTGETAKIIVNVDALLTKSQLQNAQQDILNGLKKISDQGAWHITAYQRTESKANLEQLHVEAEARVPQGGVGSVRDKAKSVSKQGVNYTIQDIIYNPSEAELETARGLLREQIYKQAQAELQRLNTLYPDQKYILHSVNFNPLVTPMSEVPGPRVAFTAMAKNAPETSVSNHLIIDAQVILASMLHTSQKTE